jgi:hypothetical protein
VQHPDSLAPGNQRNRADPLDQGAIGDIAPELGQRIYQPAKFRIGTPVTQAIRTTRTIKAHTVVQVGNVRVPATAGIGVFGFLWHEPKP